MVVSVESNVLDLISFENYKESKNSLQPNVSYIEHIYTYNIKSHYGNFRILFLFHINCSIEQP